MTRKRFTFEVKTQGNRAYTQWYDNGKPINSAEAIVYLLNEFYEENQALKSSNLEYEDALARLEEKNERLKSENLFLLKSASHVDNVARHDRDYAERMHKENKELKRELNGFKEWEKHISDVKREDLDKTFNMSIYEITEAFEYYEEKIKRLEKELQK